MRQRYQTYCPVSKQDRYRKLGLACNEHVRPKITCPIYTHIVLFHITNNKCIMSPCFTFLLFGNQKKKN